jgi:ubiquinone/menaquinone biosynthesis C-methylase UbiE
MLEAGFKGNVDSHTNDTVGGWIADPSNPSRVFDVELHLDGVPQSRVRAAFPRPDVGQHGLGSGSNGFYFALPSARRDERVKVEVKEAVSQRLVGAPVIVSRSHSPRFAGLSATEAAALVSKPLLAVGLDAFAFRGNVITLQGVYLPPGGDPFAYEVEAEDGVAFQLHRPFYDAGPLTYFWFWPNVQWGTWRIDIDLARTRHRGPVYRFAFRPRGGLPDSSELLYVPKDLGLWQNLPACEAMNRVQLYDFAEASPLRAATHCRALAGVARQHVADLAGLRVLDWGCGWGRLARTFAASTTFGEMWGLDVDHDNLAWARANVPGVKFLHAPLYPPTELPDDHFDLVYAVSVMTHLTRDAQTKWLTEVRRVLRPGGLAMLTFHGRTALAFASAFVTERTVTNFMRNGFDDATDCDHLDSIIGAGYYKNTFQTPDDVRTHWGRHLKVIETREAAVGLQDVAVLAKA